MEKRLPCVKGAGSHSETEGLFFRIFRLYAGTVVYGDVLSVIVFRSLAHSVRSVCSIPQAPFRKLRLRFASLKMTANVALTQSLPPGGRWQPKADGRSPRAEANGVPWSDAASARTRSTGSVVRDSGSFGTLAPPVSIR